MDKKHLYYAGFFVVLVSFLTLGNSTGTSDPAHRPGKSHQELAYAEQMQTFLKRQMDTYKIPGMAIAIVRNGEVEYLEGLGIANSQGDAVTPDTPFLLASVSKSITAVGAMQLIEDGKLNLDDPVQKHLPWFTMDGNNGSAITVANLLYQTSGLPEKEGREANLKPDFPDALESGVRDLANTNLAFPPGNSWEYSNLNYNILGLLIQEISGQRYEDYVAERIFEPLVMRQSHTSIRAARSAGAASGYYPFFGFPIVVDEFMPYTRTTLPAAGLWSTASDMSHYLIAHLHEGSYEGRSILSRENTEKLHQPGYMFNEEQGYAMGWTHQVGFMPLDRLKELGSDLKNYPPLTVLFHEGDWLNYKSVAFLIPELEYGVVLLLNTNDPTVTSALRFFAWDVTLIASGGKAQYFPPAEEFVVRYSRWVFVVLAVFFVIGLALSLGLLLRLRRSQTSTKTDLQKVGGFWITSFIVGGAAHGYIFLKLFPENSVNLPILIGSAPDLGILTVLIILFSIGWFATSAEALRQARSRKKLAEKGTLSTI